MLGDHGFGIERALGTWGSAARGPAELIFSENLGAVAEEPHTTVSCLAAPLLLQFERYLCFGNEEPAGVSRAMLADHHAAATMRHTLPPRPLRKASVRDNCDTQTPHVPIGVVDLQPQGSLPRCCGPSWLPAAVSFLHWFFSGETFKFTKRGRNSAA